MAWLHATPKPPAGTARAKVEGGAEDKRSRLDRLKADGIEPEMPPNPLPRLIAWFIEIGMTESTGMGSVPITWGELTEWQRNTAVFLRPWEARLLRQLSLSYLGESRRAEEETCPPPWHTEVSQRELDIAEETLRSILG